MSGIANYKNFRMISYGQIRFHHDLTGLVGFRTQPPPHRRRNDTSSPEYSAGRNFLSADDNSIRIHTRDTSVGKNLDA